MPGGLPPWEFAPPPPTPPAPRPPERSRSRKAWVVSAALGLLLCVALGFGGWGWYQFTKTRDRLTTVQRELDRRDALAAAQQRAAVQPLMTPVRLPLDARCVRGDNRDIQDGLQVALTRPDGGEVGYATMQ